MKKLLLILLFSLAILSSCERVYPQVTLDSSQVSKLIIKLNEREYLLQKDSLTTIELAKKDTLIFNLEANNGDLNRMNFNLESTNFELKKQVAVLQEGGLKWYHYTAGGGAILVIGYLLGLLSK